MTIDKDEIRRARTEFENAQHSLVLAARALEASGLPCEKTLKEVKENIGDLAIAAEALGVVIAAS